VEQFTAALKEEPFMEIIPRAFRDEILKFKSYVIPIQIKGRSHYENAPCPIYPAISFCCLLYSLNIIR